MLIYDPLLEKAFCKDFVVGLNQKDHYPEYPRPLGFKVHKTIPNVWRNWEDDTPEEISKSYTLHRLLSEDFYVEKYIRNAHDAASCLRILEENFNLIKVLHKHL